MDRGIASGKCFLSSVLFLFLLYVLDAALAKILFFIYCASISF